MASTMSTNDSVRETMHEIRFHLANLMTEADWLLDGKKSASPKARSTCMKQIACLKKLRALLQMSANEIVTKPRGKKATNPEPVPEVAQQPVSPVLATTPETEPEPEVVDIEDTAFVSRPRKVNKKTKKKK